MSQQQEQQVESDDSGIDIKLERNVKLKLHLKWNLI